MFPLAHLNTRGSCENSRQLCKPETQSSVCLTVENYEAIETRKKVLYCFYKIFLNDNSTNEGKCCFFFYFLIETDFLDAHSCFLPPD